MPEPPDLALALGLAIVAASHAPLLLIDADLSVIAASASFCQCFQLEPAIVPGRSVGELGGGEWNLPQLTQLLRGTAAGYADIAAYEMDLVRPGRPTRRLVLNAHKLVYAPDHAGAGPARLLLNVADVTEARLRDRLRDDLVREKSILLQEMQHRVANSLQIIASVLLQSARRVQSDETRTHLVDAHQRVMSIAALQRQLAVADRDEVKLRDYLTELCASIGASMIADRSQIGLSVEADASVTSADVSVSLGLIVTELVINALKHAFPRHRQGHVEVGYSAAGPDWTLSVRDDGVGMPDEPSAAKPGLGTSIVTALAKQLGAAVRVAGAEPGTTVSIVYTQSDHDGAAAASRPAVAAI